MSTLFDQIAYGPDVNVINPGNVYPLSGYTLGVGASAGSPASAPPVVASSGMQGVGVHPDVQAAAATGATGSPMGVWIALTVLLVILMFTTQKLAGDERFAHIKLSVYNVLVIAWAAIIGITFWKIVFTKIKIPGLSSVILAS